MNTKITEIAAQHLGNAGSYSRSEKIDNNLLVAIPRSLSRKESDITVTDFRGYDVWNAYEFSVLRNNGFPVIARLKIVYSSDSEFIVESKSLKLYLHTFNYEKLGRDAGECMRKAVCIIQSHLSELLKTPVVVSYFTGEGEETPAFNDEEFADLDKYIDTFEPDNHSDNKHCKSILQIVPEGMLYVVPDFSECGVHSFKSNSLKSNCRVTHQPDWATIYIKICSTKNIDAESILRYIVSLRNEDHFHEEACELVFNDLYLAYNPVHLFVGCLYTRRGGIDINPIRYIGTDYAKESLQNPSCRIKRTFRQ